MEGWPSGPRQRFAKPWPRKGPRGFKSHPFRMNKVNEEGVTQLLVLRVDLNAGVMFGELVGEPNHEAVAKPRRRKPTRAAAKSHPFRMNKSHPFRIGAWRVRLMAWHRS